MKLNKKIDYVNSIEANCEFAIVEKLIFDLNKGQQIPNSYDGLSSIASFGTNNLIAKNKRGHSYIIDRKTLDTEETGKINAFSFPYLQFYTQTEPRIYSIYNYKTKETLFETENWIGRKIIKEHIFGDNEGLITSRKTNSSQILWEYATNIFGNYLNQWQEQKPYQVKEFVGIWNNQLIVQLTGGRFIGLGVNNGDLLWDLKEVKHNQTNQPIDYGFGDPYNPFLDEETGHVFMLQGEVLIDLDLNKLEATYVWNVKDLPLESYPFIRQSRMYDGKIYFTARSYINNDDDMVGVFDLSKNKIVWQHIFDFDKGTFISNSQENIQVNSENLLVLDNKGTLYIFENEQ